MPTRSQRHKEEIQGPFTPPVPPVVPTIVINTLSPANGPANTTMGFSVLGVGLLPDDEIVFGGSVHQSEYIFGGQIDVAQNDPVVTGVPRSVPVYVKRGAEISNTLQFTVYAAAPAYDTMFNRANESPGAGNVDGAVTVGLTFYTTGGVTGKVRRVSFWKPADDPTTARSVGVYDQVGALITSTSTSGEAAGPRWVDVTLPTPVDVTPGVYFTAAVHFPNAAGHYPAEASRYPSAPTPSLGGKFYAAARGEHIGNGTYNYGGALTYPNAGTAGSNFWVDIGFEAN